VLPFSPGYLIKTEIAISYKTNTNGKTQFTSFCDNQEYFVTSKYQSGLIKDFGTSCDVTLTSFIPNFSISFCYPLEMAGILCILVSIL